MYIRLFSYLSRCLILKNKRRYTEVYRLFWCEKRDLNPYGVTTRPSNVRVCQFRHSRIYFVALSRNIDIILHFISNVNPFFEFFLIFLKNIFLEKFSKSY